MPDGFQKDGFKTDGFKKDGFKTDGFIDRFINEGWITGMMGAGQMDDGQFAVILKLSVKRYRLLSLLN